MLLALAAALLLGAAPGQGLIITQDTPVVVPPGSLNSTAFTLAWRDVQQDWYRVLGKLPFVFDAVPGNESLTFTSFGNGTVGPVAQPVVVFLGHASDVAALLPAVAAPLAGALRGPESHTCCQYPFNASLGYAPLVCGGADELGSVYAAYTLSHSVLGVDPQYFFTDNDPAYAGSVDPAANPDVAACKVHSLTKDSFRYRGFFVNDEVRAPARPVSRRNRPRLTLSPARRTCWAASSATQPAAVPSPSPPGTASSSTFCACAATPSSWARQRTRTRRWAAAPVRPRHSPPPRLLLTPPCPLFSVL